MTASALAAAGYNVRGIHPTGAPMLDLVDARRLARSLPTRQDRNAMWHAIEAQNAWIVTV